ncbi:MAG: rod shape-determining protein MreD [Syntrophomonadaceae bacterium]|jgi:rod shape-determining protein MreD|nr:rod shape-determining protein MreD [Syntrophomonadaceae bacterium]
MRLLILLLLPALSLLLQSTFFGFYSIYGVIPDIVLIFTVLFALLHNYKQATIYGFFCGLLEDLYVGNMIGMNALAKGLTAYIISKLQVQVFKENIIVSIIGVLLGTVLNTAVIIVITLTAGKPLIFNMEFLWDFGLQILYNVALSIPAYLFYYNSTRTGWLENKGNN